MRLDIVAVLLLLSASVAAADTALEFGGHTKLDLTAQTFPRDSLIRDLLGSDSLLLQADLRLDLNWRHERWTFDAAYQLLAQHIDGGSSAAGLPSGIPVLAGRLPSDRRRLFDFTKTISDSTDDVVLQRLDRLWAGYASDSAVIRFGRQALTWGNGLIYAPMDLVNPFDPAAIDTEYKAGDDMLYAQFLRDNGEDLQLAVVFRRSPLTGDVDSDQATTAAKYHGFYDEFEYDVLVGESYDNTVLGFGLRRGVGGAQWSADLVVTDTRIDTYAELVANVSYSWILAGRNATGVLEYYYNGFGRPGNRYGPADIGVRVDLLSRLARGQSFTLGRHYLAGSVTVEMTPLWNVAPVLLANLGDPSALLQLTSRYSLSDNMTLTGSLNVPFGANGSEFGGIDTAIPGRYLSSDAALYAQIAWYF